MQTLPLWTALVTPFNHQEIDFESLKTLIKEQENAGNGILLLGSTGEALNMALDEKKRLAEFVLTNKPSVPVMIGVSGAQLQEQVNWIHFCDRLGADAFLLVTPFYSRPGALGQTHWFTALANATKKPCMLYNIPARTATKLSVEALKNVAKLENVYALKEASGSIEDFEAYKKAAPELQLYSGNDSMVFELCKRGACGLIGVMSNVFPRLSRCYVEDSLEQNRSEIVTHCEKHSEALNCQNPLPAKTLLYRKGLIESDQLLPPLNIEDLTSEVALTAADQTLSPLEASLQDILLHSPQ